MKIRALICVWLAGMLGLAMCGSGLPDIGLSSGQGRYAAGLRTGLHNNGGGAAGWDTIYNVYTMNPALNHVAVNIHGATGAFGDSVKVDNQDRAITVADSLENLGKGNVFTLGLGTNGTYEAATDDSTFAYALIDTLWTAATLDTLAAGPQRLNAMQLRAVASWDFTASDKSRGRPLLMHFDPKVPANATVVSAVLHLNAESVYTSQTDSVVATLMSRAGWGSWYKYRGQWSTWNNADPASGDCYLRYAAKCGYTNQVQYKTADDRHGFHYTTRDQWSPAWSSLPYYYSRGDVSDITSLGNKNGDGAKRYDLAIDITDCVQAIANGATNNGIIIQPKIATAANRTLNTTGFETPRRLPAASWIDIKYITKRYATNFPGGKTWAFVFQTDDGRKTANDAYAAEFAAHGGKYTIYATKNFLNTAGIATAADLLAWYNLGNEIGLHSVAHKFAGDYQINYWGHGPAANGYAATDTTTYAAGWDSMRVSLSRAWILSLGDSLGISRDDRRWGKSMALPGNQWSPWTTVLCQQLGYSTVRCGQAGLIGLPADAKMGLAFSDSAVNGTGARIGRAPRNVMMLPTWFGIESVVGAKTNTTITEAQVKFNARKLIEQIKAGGWPVLSLFVHDFKTNPSGAGYAEGLDREELDWILDVVDEEGGHYMTATEYGDWVRRNSTPIDTPASARRDSFPCFKFEASDGVWYKPHGIDNRWIRGVK